MKLKNIVFGCVLLMACCAVAASAKKGSCISKAFSLKGSQKVTLVAEYDKDEEKGERLSDDGVAYYKVTLKRGQAYTIWITGGSAASMSLDVDTNWEYYEKSEKREDSEPGAGFDIDEIDEGATQVAYLYADDWTTGEAVAEDNDPKEGHYIVMISGDIGATTTLNYVKGIKSFTRTGSEESPRVISMSNSWKSYSGSLVEGAYHFRATLKAGRKYRVRTLLGKKGQELTLSVDDGVDNDSYNEDDDGSGDESSNVSLDSEFSKVLYNEAYVVVPDTSGKYSFVVDGDTAQKFKFSYRAVPTRAIAKHPTIPLLEEEGYAATFVPGRLANTQNYYDEIIDEHLCKIYLAKGERWVFETEGATAAQQMIAYNSSGKVLATNETMGNGDFNTRVAITATEAGLYYVGVCDPTLDVGDQPDGVPITLRARNVTEYAVPDAFDPVDDKVAGATVLVPYPATTNDSAYVVTTSNEVAATQLGAIHGPHGLGANDLYDTFAIACRKGYTYKLAASYADEDVTTNSLTLAAKVFFMNGSKEMTQTATGSLEIGDDLVFVPKYSCMYYVRVYVGDGRGLDFPNYNIHAIVGNGTNELGLVRTDIEGGVGTWSPGRETVTKTTKTTTNAKTGKKTTTTTYVTNVVYETNVYPSGATIHQLPTDKIYARLNAVTGFKASACIPTFQPIPVWNPGDAPVLFTGAYSDAYDAKYTMSSSKNAKTGKTTYVYSPADGDATRAGAFAITPAAKAVTLKRTLWEADPADHFSFTAAAGVYYDFTLKGTTNVTLEVLDAAGTVLATGTQLAEGDGLELARLLLPAGKTYVKVAHVADADPDAVYTLTYSRASTGVVQFVMPTSKTTKTVKGKTTTVTVTADRFTANEGAEYATLTVRRTGTEGKVRVRYATQQISEEAAAERGCVAAVPGDSYYPATNVISWAAGDKANKTIKVRLLPDLNAHWASSNRMFSVVLYPMDEYALAAGEYPARTNDLGTAVVMIKEAQAKAPGTISLAAYGAEDAAIANAKAPAVTATANDAAFPLVFARTGGTDGEVSVKIATTFVKGDTAKAGVDYEAKSETLTWADGDDAPKTFTLNLPAAVGTAVSKKMTLSIAAVKGAFTPVVAAKTATVTILSDTVAQTVAAYAKTIPAASGIKLAAKGTWFNDPSGTLRSANAPGTLTYTLTGPGFFACRPKVVQPEVGDEAMLVCTIDGESIPCPSGDRIARVLGAKTTVTFTLSDVVGGAYAAFDPEVDGAPYLWVPFSGSAAYEPMAKAVVAESLDKLVWTLPAALTDEPGLYCRVRFDAGSKATTVHAYDLAHEGTCAMPQALEPGKTYSWGLDYAYTDATGLTVADAEALSWTSGATWSFSVLKDGQPTTEPAATAFFVDASGAEVSLADCIAADEAVELIQGVRPSLALDAAGTLPKATKKTSTGSIAVTTQNMFRVVGGALPKGLSINATTGAFAGAPSTVGESRALLQRYWKVTTATTVTKTKKTTTKTAYVYGGTVAVNFRVVPSGSSVGAFRAVLVEDGSQFETDARRLANLSVTVTAAGKITAKATIAGVNYSFSGTGYDEILERDETLPGLTRRLRVKLANTTKINKKTNYKNYLTLDIGDGVLTNGVALAESVGAATLEMNVADVKLTKVTPDVIYAGDVFRSVTDATVADAGAFAGYYTIALPPEGASASVGEPTGNGYLTLTVAADGAAKFSGALADGTAVSCSSVSQLLGADAADGVACTNAIPFYVGKSSLYAAAGVVRIVVGADGVPVALPASKIIWTKSASATTTPDKTGFGLSLAPTGGWYDKVVNLQRYYVNRTFAVETVEDGDELPTAALASGYSFTTKSVPQSSLAVRFVGDKPVVNARKLVKNKTTGLYDTWEKDGYDTSVNPWNVTFKFTRATGLVTGTLSAWEWVFKTDLEGRVYATQQKEVKNLAHKGVLVMARDASSESPLADDVLTAGFFLMPGTTKTITKKNASTFWYASLPFNIVTTMEDEPDWTEPDLAPADVTP